MREIVEVALFTADVEAAKAFYGDLLAVEPDAEWPDGAIFAAGLAKLLLHARGSEPADGPPNEDHFALSVSDVDRSYEELRARGFAFLVEPRDYSWGRSAYLRDPDGRLVELSQAER